MYKTDQITDDSYGDLQTLYRLSFDLDPAIDFLRSKYDTSAFGLKNIGFIARAENGEPAAYYGVFPIILNYNSQDFLVAQSGDTMTAPQHQKKGLFTMLARQTYELSQEKGIRLIFGFPNENSYPGFKNKLDWQFHGCMQKFTLTVNTIPLCELCARFPGMQSWYDRFLHGRIARYKIWPDEIDSGLFNFSRVKGRIKKDKKFFEYKIEKNGVYLIQIDTFKLLVKARIHLYIGEVGRFDKSQVRFLIISVRKLARRLGCKKVIFTLSLNHWLYDILREHIEPEESLPIGFYLYDQTIDPEEIQFSNADYDTF